MERSRRWMLGAAVLALSAGAGLPARAAEKVAVRLSWTPFAVHIPIYVAKAKGFYAQHGLDVDIRPGRGSSFSALTVGSGQEQFGVADAAASVAARAKGVPIVVIANFQQDNGAALFAREASGITKVADLKGKNVGVYVGSTTTIFLQALLKKNGLSLQDISPITVRSGTDLPLVLQGKIDAEVSIYNNELVSWHIQYPDLRLRIWKMQDFGFATPGNALITNERLIKEKPSVVRSFDSATMEGIDYAFKQPEEAVAILIKAVPELKYDVELAKWRSYMETVHSAETDKRGTGALDRAKWTTLVRLLQEYDNLPVNFDLKPMLQDQFRAAR